MLITDRGDGRPADEVQAREKDFLFGGVVTADAGGIGFVILLHGWVLFPGHRLTHQVNSDIPGEAGLSEALKDFVVEWS